MFIYINIWPNLLIQYKTLIILFLLKAIIESKILIHPCNAYLLI